MEILSDQIIESLTKYYRNRDMYIHANRVWNRDEDIQNIIRVAKPEGWDVQESGGTFWFIQTGGIISNRIIKITEKNYKTGGTSNIIADHNPPLGFLSGLKKIFKGGKS